MRVGRGGPRRGFFERVCRGQQREGPEQNLLRALQEHRQEQEEQDDGEGGAVMQHNNSKMARNLNESEFVFAIWQKFCSCYLTTMSHIFLSL